MKYFVDEFCVKMRQSRWPWALCMVSFVAVLTMFLATGCADKPVKPIRLGINVWPGYERLFIAEEKGFFEDEALPIELIELGSLADVRRAFEQNRIDGMTSTLIEVVEAYHQSGRLAKTALISDFSEGADLLLALPKIQNIQALRGKRIGTEFGSLGLYLVVRALELNGLTLEDVEIVNITQDHLVRAMEDKRVDAVMTYPPVSIQLESEFGMHRIFDSSEIPNEVLGCVSFAEEVFERFPDCGAKLRRIWGRTMEYVEANPEEANRFMAGRQGITPSEFIASLDGLALVSEDQQLELLKLGGVVEKVIEIIDGQVLSEWNAAAKPHPSDFIEAL